MKFFSLPQNVQMRLLPACPAPLGSLRVKNIRVGKLPIKAA